MSDRIWRIGNIGIAWVRYKAVSLVENFQTRTASTYDLIFGSNIAASFVADKYRFGHLLPGWSLLGGFGVTSWLRPRRPTIFWLRWRGRVSNVTRQTDFQYTGGPTITRSTLPGQPSRFVMGWPATSSTSVQITRDDPVLYASNFTLLDLSHNPAETDFVVVNL